MKNYKDLSDTQKKQILIELYEKNNKSFADIAEMYGTYPNKVRRDAIKHNIKIKTKSQAQRSALKTGKTNHPTKGKTRTIEEKNKIGMGVYKSWQNADEQTIKDRKLKSSQNWKKIDKDKKEHMLSEANKAVRLASKTGSKLEKFFLKELIDCGYKVDFHKQQALGITKLEIDLFLPTINVAIEVDGPSHFQDIWGEENLKRNKKYDSKKTGLILGRGWYLIRVKQNKDFSKSYASVLYDKLYSKIQEIQNKPKSDSQLKEILIEE